MTSEGVTYGWPNYGHGVENSEEEGRRGSSDIFVNVGDSESVERSSSGSVEKLTRHEDEFVAVIGAVFVSLFTGSSRNIGTDVAKTDKFMVTAEGVRGEMWKGEEERSETHDGNSCPNPYWLGSSSTSSKIADWEEKEERCNVVTVGNKSCLC